MKRIQLMVTLIALLGLVNTASAELWLGGVGAPGSGAGLQPGVGFGAPGVQDYGAPGLGVQPGVGLGAPGVPGYPYVVPPYPAAAAAVQTFDANHNTTVNSNGDYVYVGPYSTITYSANGTVKSVTYKDEAGRDVTVVVY